MLLRIERYTSVYTCPTSYLLLRMGVVSPNTVWMCWGCEALADALEHTYMVTHTHDSFTLQYAEEGREQCGNYGVTPRSRVSAT